MTCPHCGIAGIHACPGEPVPAWMPEKVRELRAVLRRYETPASRNQREGRYVGRLQGRHGKGKRFVRCRHFDRRYVRAILATAVWSRSAGLIGVPRRPFREPYTPRHQRRFHRALSLAMGRPVAYHLPPAARERLRQMLRRGREPT